MTTPSTGIIAFSDVNTELGKASNAAISLNDANVRELAGAPFTIPNSTVTFNDLRGKTALVKSGLILHLDAGNYNSYTGSGTSWIDLSSSGNNGTLVNGVSYNSSNGGSLVFDGSNDYVTSSSDMFNPNSNFTVSFWVQNSATGTYTYLSSIGKFDSIQIRWNHVQSRLQLLRSFTGLIGNWTGFTAMTDGQWYNIAVRRSTNTFSLYVNGSFISDLTSATTFAYGPSCIGTQSDSNNPTTFVTLLNGRFSSTMAYNRALSAAEILQNYNAMSIRY